MISIGLSRQGADPSSFTTYFGTTTCNVTDIKHRVVVMDDGQLTDGGDQLSCSWCAVADQYQYTLKTSDPVSRSGKEGGTISSLVTGPSEYEFHCRKNLLCNDPTIPSTYVIGQSIPCWVASTTDTVSIFNCGDDATCLKVKDPATEKLAYLKTAGFLVIAGTVLLPIGIICFAAYSFRLYKDIKRITGRQTVV